MHPSDAQSLYSYLSRVVPKGSADESELVRLMSVLKQELKREHKSGSNR